MAGGGDAGLRFTVLGPVGAHRGGAELDLGPAKRRAVLAMLLLNANWPVSRADIIDGVWGERVPRSAPNLVATYVAGLRRVLDPGRVRRSGGTVLGSTSTGYALRLPAGRLDLERFGLLVAGAHTGPVDRTASMLDDALALWRGPPLDGLPGPFAAAERQRLVELRLTVVEQRIEVGLALGEDRVAELSRLVALHPYRERLCALHMLALHRAGRRAEALDAFGDARRMLSENLGIEPGAELRRLHRQILAADPVLDAPPGCLRCYGPAAGPNS